MCTLAHNYICFVKIIVLVYIFIHVRTLLISTKKKRVCIVHHYTQKRRRTYIIVRVNPQVGAQLCRARLLLSFPPITIILSHVPI